MIEEEFAMAKFASKADRDDALLSEIARLRAEVARQHDEIMRLRMYAPGQHRRTSSSRYRGSGRRTLPSTECPT